MTGNPEMCNRRHLFKGKGKWCVTCGHARTDDCHHRRRFQYDQEQSARNRIGLEIAREATTASEEYGPFTTLPEAWGVLQMELRELEAEALVNRKKRDVAKVREEAVQVAGTLLNLIYYYCDGE